MRTFDKLIISGLIACVWIGVIGVWNKHSDQIEALKHRVDALEQAQGRAEALATAGWHESMAGERWPTEQK